MRVAFRRLFSSSSSSSSSAQASLQEKVVSLCKRRGFAFLDSDIYGGLANTYDFGPVGVELRRKLRNRWWRDFVLARSNCHGIETPVMMHPAVWRTAGHVENFADDLVECKVCHQRLRADKLDERICPNGGAKAREKCEFTDPKRFNMLFQSNMGPVQDTSSLVYMRPETAQGIFVNYPMLAQVTRAKLPFGIAQIGKAFRNEISPGNFLFRLREFEQMELEFFCAPSETPKWFTYWREYCMQWLLSLGLRAENLRFVDHAPGEAAHYAAAGSDIEYRFPFGWGELWGIANRTDYDLRNHAQASGKKMVPENESLPHCVEPSVGLERLMLAVLCDAFHEEKVSSTTTEKGEKSGEEEEEGRVVLKLHPAVAPFTAAVFPLMKKPQLVEVAESVHLDLLRFFATDYDTAGSIGKRYRRHDEIGTPFCITVDFESLDDKCVTVRQRDSLVQERVPIAGLVTRVFEMVERAERPRP